MAITTSISTKSLITLGLMGMVEVKPPSGQDRVALSLLLLIYIFIEREREREQGSRPREGGDRAVEACVVYLKTKATRFIS